MSTLAALACPARSSPGATAASCASLAFAAAGGCARFAAAAPFTAPVTWANAGSAAGLTPGGGTGGASSWSEVSGARRTSGRHRPRLPPERGPGQRRAPVAAPFGPAAFAGFAAALPSGLTFGTGFGGGTGFFAGTASGPNPVRTTASADAGGFCAAPSRSTGTPAAFAAFSPFSTVSTAGSSRRTSRRAASMSDTASAPGDRIRPASSALTAAFPAAALQRQQPWRRSGPTNVAVGGLARNLGRSSLPLGSRVRHSPRITHNPSVAKHHPTQYRLARGLSGRPACPKGKYRWLHSTPPAQVAESE